MSSRTTGYAKCSLVLCREGECLTECVKWAGAPHPQCLIQRLCDSTLSCIFNKASRDCDVTSRSISLEASCPCCQCPNKLHKHRFPSCLCVAGMQCLSRLRCGAMWNSFAVLQYVLQAVPCCSSQIRITVSLNAPYSLCHLHPVCCDWFPSCVSVVHPSAVYC